MRGAVVAALMLYFATVLALVLTGKPGRMMGGAILAAAPVLIALYEALASAREERGEIVAELRALRVEIEARRDEV